MIRLPPSSISLSESDLQVHLKQIDIYQSLLQQGFKRDAILRLCGEKSCVAAEPPPDQVQAFDTQQVGSQTSDKGRDGSYNYRHQWTRGTAPEESYADGQQRTSDKTRDESYTDGPQWTSDKTRDEPYSDGLRWHSRDGRCPNQYQGFSAAFRKNLPLGQEPQGEGVSSSDQHRGFQDCEGTSTAGGEVVQYVPRYGERGIAPSSVELRTRYQRTPSSTSTIYNEVLRQTSRGRHDADEHSIPSIEPEPSSPLLGSQVNLSIRHRPRQSSMLHITRNADSPSSSGQSDDSFKSTVTEMPATASPGFAKSPRTRTMKYRTRSQTYPWVQSEADDLKASAESSSRVESTTSFQPPSGKYRTTSTEVRDIQANRKKSPPTEACPTFVTRIEPLPVETSIVTSHRQVSMSTPLRPEAEDFVPLKLPPPFSANRRISSGQHTLPSCNASPNSVNYDVRSQSSPNLAVSTPPRSSSLASLNRQLGSSFISSSSRGFPSSPPKVRDLDSSPSMQVPPAPTPRRSRQVFEETQPRAPPKTPRTQARSQQTDGPGTVYDDRRRAHLQPRTPADLARGSYVTQREAAYTAPPGRTARTPATISQSHISPIRTLEPGEESPSRRAQTIRERRRREVRRGAAVEDMIWRELNGDVDGASMPWETPGSSLEGSWRYDLAVDRTGEENFESEEMMQQVATRPSNGNLRARRQA